MLSSQDHKQVQEKWSKKWELTELLYKAIDFSNKPKKYILVEYPYPSAAGLHMGHCRNYSMLDTYARYYRHKGFNVLYPMGWDSFGLPTYNYAVKVGRAPQDVSKENVAVFKRQLQSLGLSFDWSREVDTSAPSYYKWTQWIFIKLYESWYDSNFKRIDGGRGAARPVADLPIPKEIKGKGLRAIKEYQDQFRLAYKSKMPVSWCPKCKQGLANEEVLENGTHERCGTLVESKMLEQWILRITAYAERLLTDLSMVDYPAGVKTAQIDWIGKKTGIINFYKVVGKENLTIDCFTTTPVNYGATFIVVSPEYSKLWEIVTPENKEAVQQYVMAAKNKPEHERENKDKTGVFTGTYVLNDLTGKEIPVYVADFVLAGTGTGAVQGCPGHDLRDFEFAKKHNLPIVRVVIGEDGDSSDITMSEQIVSRGMKGTMTNSDFLNGLSFEEGMIKTMDYLEEKRFGKRVTIYKLHDWIFSRQHYWGEPTPMVFCEQCGWSPIDVMSLPVELPNLPDYTIGENGESPLERAEDWKIAKCPTCGGKATRETDVMPNWAGSNWYFLRYLDPKNKEKLVDKNKADYWMPVDIYDGGSEHVTLHLLYSRFIYKFLYDLGVAPGAEPYAKRRIHGVVLGSDGKKMSKSVGNVINPDEIVEKYGADVVRMYVMFMGPYDGLMPWSEKTLMGVKRFLDKLYKFTGKMVKDTSLEHQNGEREPNNASNSTQNGEVKIAIMKLAKRIGEDIEQLKFNTAIAALMEFMNNFENSVWNNDQIRNFLVIIAPFAPFFASEAWENLVKEGEVHLESWPIIEERLLHEEIIEIPVMVNGKVRSRLKISANASQEEVEKLALKDDSVKKFTEQGIKKKIYIPKKAINLVV